VKIVYWPLLPQRLPLCAMPREKARSFIVAKVMCASVLPLPNVYLVYAIQFQLVRT
jgi:hypothetical protein